MTDKLFSHPAEAEHVVTTGDSCEPVEMPEFSDRDR